MYNVVFVGVDGLGTSFAENKEALDEIIKLKENIESISEGLKTIIYFISSETLNDVMYNASVLMNIFNLYTAGNPNLEVKTLLTKDAISDLTVNKANGGETIKSNLDTSLKQVRALKSIGRRNIAKTTHVGHGIYFDVHEFLLNIPTTVMTDDFESTKEIITKDYLAKDMTYIVSASKGLKGYNECFETYFEDQKAPLLIK